jgi:hypothetical protein
VDAKIDVLGRRATSSGVARRADSPAGSGQQVMRHQACPA